MSAAPNERQLRLVEALNANPEFISARRCMLWGAGLLLMFAAACLGGWLAGYLTVLPAVVFGVAVVVNLMVFAPRLARMQQEASQQLEQQPVEQAA